MDRIGRERDQDARNRERQRERSVTPRLRDLLQAAAARERRSLTNALAMLLTDYSRLHGLFAVDATGKPMGSTLKGAPLRTCTAADPRPEISAARRTRNFP